MKPIWLLLSLLYFDLSSGAPKSPKGQKVISYDCESPNIKKRLIDYTKVGNCQREAPEEMFEQGAQTFVEADTLDVEISSCKVTRKT